MDLNKDCLLKQYEQLNERSRKYTSQIWIIPFSFYSILGIIISFLINNEFLSDRSYVASITFFSLSVICFIILIHMLSVIYNNKRAIIYMQIIEDDLNLYKTTKDERNVILTFQFYIKLSLIIVEEVALGYGIYFLPVMYMDQLTLFLLIIISVIISLFIHLIIFIYDLEFYKKFQNDLDNRVNFPA